MKNSLKFYLAAVIIVLISGCSKDPDPIIPPPPPTADTIKLTVLATYPGDLTITNNTLVLSVSGQADLSYSVPLGQDYVITITGDAAKVRKGKAATLKMSCRATRAGGAATTICYNYDNGVTSVSSLAANNAKIEWVGADCGVSNDQVILRAKITLQPGNYTVGVGALVLMSQGLQNRSWTISNIADTTIVLNDNDALSRIGKPYALKVYFTGYDLQGNPFSFTWNYLEGTYYGDTLKADNPKIEFIGYKGK